MKINKILTFAALAATLPFQTSITRADDDDERRDWDNPLPVAIYDTFKLRTDAAGISLPTPGFTVTFTGVVTIIIGPDVVTGTSRMDVNLPGADIARCQYTWVIPGEGTLRVTSSTCKLAGNNGIGAWSTGKSTGSFKHFKAIGTETFGPIPLNVPATVPPTPGGFTDFERFAGIGTVSKKHRHDD